MPLIILAHPHYDVSITNRAIINELQSYANIEIRHIHQLYPNYQIDVQAEQEALLRHDTIILQFPLFWFSTPAILKQWFDQVFTYQFAYGSQGDKLKGKKLMISCTVGQPEDAYDGSPDKQPPIDLFFEWIKHSAHYAQMNYQGSICSYEHSPVLGYTESERIARSRLHAQKLSDKLQLVQK